MIKHKNSLNINNFLKKDTGITLITLVVMIVIVMILSTITIKIAIDDNGLINSSKREINRYKEYVEEEEKQINELYNEKIKNNY